MRLLRRNALKRCVLLIGVSFLTLSAIIMCSPILLVHNSNSKEPMESRNVDIDLHRTRKISANSSLQSLVSHHQQPRKSSQDHQPPPPLPQDLDHQHSDYHLSPAQPVPAKKQSQPLSKQPPVQPPSPQIQLPSKHPSVPPSLPNSKPPKVHGPVVQKPECTKPHCTEFLSRTDLTRQRSCYMEVTKNNKGVPTNEFQAMILENDCNFMNGGGRAPVALVSAEGSGNTWVRGLLERATGICTGFNFCDYVMRMKGFIGDNINSGSVLVVKTHMDKPQWVGDTGKKLINKFEAKYGSGILLLRNPYDSLIAEWNRRLTNDVLIKRHMPHNESHTNVAPKEIWYSKDWDKFLHMYMEAWLNRLQNWVLSQSAQHPVIVVKYEDLKQDTMKEVERMLGFLGLPFDEESISQRLAQDFTVFKRPHREEDEFEHYTHEQIEHMRSVVLQAIELVEKKDMTHLVKLDDYLEKFK